MNENISLIVKIKDKTFFFKENTYFSIPKYKTISNVDDLKNHIKIIACCIDSKVLNNYEANIEILSFESLLGEKKIYFRKARRNAKHRTRGFREKLFSFKIGKITLTNEIKSV